MQIQHMQTVDAGFLFRIVALAGQDIVVQHFVGEAQLILVAHSAQAVRRCLPDKLPGQTQTIAHLQDFMNQKLGKRAEITGCIAVFGRVAHIVLRGIAGIDNTSAVGQILRDRIKSRHADPGRHIDLGLAGHLCLAADLLKLLVLLKSFFQRVRCRADIDLYIRDLQSVDQKLAVRNIRLHAAGHQNTHDTVSSQRLNAKGCRHAGILASGNADHRAAGRSVCRKIVADPLHNFIFCLFRIFQHISLLIPYANQRYQVQINIIRCKSTLSSSTQHYPMHIDVIQRGVPADCLTVQGFTHSFDNSVQLNRLCT